MVRRSKKEVEREVSGIGQDLYADLKDEIIRVIKSNVLPQIKERYLAIYDKIAADAQAKRDQQAGREDVEAASLPH